MSYNIPAQSIFDRLPGGATPENADGWADLVTRLINNQTGFQKTTKLTPTDLGSTSENWNKFTLSAFAADLASYPKIEDQADYPRLTSVIESFPQGFSVYFSEVSGDVFLPVGYTGWYPVSEQVFDLLDKSPEKITNRGDMRPVEMTQDSYIYLFNYSIAAPLRQTEHSRSLINDFVKTITDLNVRGLAAVTVSPDGIRIAEKFGMTCSGQMTHMNDIENVYTKRFDL